MQETWVRSLGWEDPLEKEKATHFSTLAWKIPWTEKPGRLQSVGSQRVGHDWATSLHFSQSLKELTSHVNQWMLFSSGISCSCTHSELRRENAHILIPTSLSAILKRWCMWPCSKHAEVWIQKPRSDYCPKAITNESFSK